jgi:hypothetical protein
MEHRDLKFHGIHPATSSKATIVPLVNSLQLVTGAVDEISEYQFFETFEDYVNQRQWLVPEAPRPMVNAFDLDSASYWVEDLTSTSGPNSVGDKSLLGQHGREHAAAEMMDDIEHSKDGDELALTLPSVRSAASSLTNLRTHPVVSDAFIPTTTRAGRTTKVTKNFLQTADQQSHASSSLRPANDIGEESGGLAVSPSFLLRL